MLVSSNTCAWICEHPVDMRKSIDALAVLVEPLFNANPLSGHLFVFLCRHRIGVKILYWDRKYLPLKVRAMINFLLEIFKTHAPADAA